MMRTKQTPWLSALVVGCALTLAACGAGTPTADVEGALDDAPTQPDAPDAGTTTPTDVADPTNVTVAQESPAPERTEPAAMVDAAIVEPDVFEAEIVEWESGEQAELLLTVAGTRSCSGTELSCDSEPTGLFTVVAAEGITTVRLPIATGVDTIDTVEVSHAEFESFLEGGVHPAALDPSGSDRFLLVLEPRLTGDTTGLGELRMASEVLLLMS